MQGVSVQISVRALNYNPVTASLECQTSSRRAQISAVHRTAIVTAMIILVSMFSRPGNHNAVYPPYTKLQLFIASMQIVVGFHVAEMDSKAVVTAGEVVVGYVVIAEWQYQTQAALRGNTTIIVVVVPVVFVLLGLVPNLMLQAVWE